MLKSGKIEKSEYIVIKVFLKITKGEFSIEPWYALVKIAPSVYESVQVY